MERLVSYLYSKHLEENASPLFNPRLVVTNLEGESNEKFEGEVNDWPIKLALKSGGVLELESLEVQLSVPSVWKALSDKSQHLACWYARQNWLRLAAWRVAVKRHLTWRQRLRALNWKEQVQLLNDMLKERQQ